MPVALILEVSLLPCEDKIYTDGHGWHPPQPISDAVASAGVAVAMGKQSAQVLTMLLVDEKGRLEVAWLDLTDGLPWHSPRPIYNPVAPVDAHIAMDRQSP